MQINIRGGFAAIIDDEDGDLVAPHKWYYCGGYAAGYVAGKTIRMHRLILQPPAGLHVDHINRNKLDNRRSNLRLCTPQQNNCNTVRADRNRTGFRGVFPTTSNLFRAEIEHCGSRYRSKKFKIPTDAARAYDALALALHGEFAVLNFGGQECRAISE